MATATPYHREGYSHGKYEGSYVPIWRLSSVSISSVYSMLLRKKWGNKIYSLKFQKKKKKIGRKIPPAHGSSYPEKDENRAEGKQMEARSL